MEISKVALTKEIREKLISYCYDVIGCIQVTHKELGPGMPEYIYQEALVISLQEKGYSPLKEYIHHPLFHGKELKSYQKMDIMIPMPKGNIIIECKAIKELKFEEQYQTWGYLRGTEFPIAILVNFGTWPKAEIHRYYYDKENKAIHAF